MQGIVRGSFTYYPHPEEGKEQVLVCTTEGLNKVTSYARSIEQFEWWVENINIQPRNLLTHRDDTILAMAEIEWLSMGDRGGWLELECRLLDADDEDHTHWEYSVAGAIKHVVKVRRRYIGEIQEAKDTGCLDQIWKPQGWLDKPEVWERKSCCFTIYGSGGFNRYHVLNNGDVVLSGYNSRDAMEGAKLLGFEVK